MGNSIETPLHKCWTCEEYHRRAECGVLEGGYELIEGGNLEENAAKSTVCSDAQTTGKTSHRVIWLGVCSYSTADSGRDKWR